MTKEHYLIHLGSVVQKKYSLRSEITVGHCYFRSEGVLTKI
jgi:hypothetical protein